MSGGGALIVITIPTEDEEEKRLSDKTKKIRFDLPSNRNKFMNPQQSSSISINNFANNNNKLSSKTKSNVNKFFNTSSFCDFQFQYGTFNQIKSTFFSPDRKQLPNDENYAKIAVNEETGNKSSASVSETKCVSKNDTTTNVKIPSKDDTFSTSTNVEQQKIEVNVDNNQPINKEPSTNGNNTSKIIEITTDSSMEAILRDILRKLKIENITWQKSNDEKFYQVTFLMEYDEKYETILKEFNEWGIGDREGSTVAVLHCTLFNTFTKDMDNEEKFNNQDEINIKKQTAWNRFMNSFTARLNVAQIVRDIKQEASITFDFIVLLISAAILASFGLVGDSTIFLASSMLVSPLMGPIIATIFGTAIKDRSLQSLGIINELIGIILATLVGYVFAIIMCAIDEKYKTGDGFTAEILARCELNSLLVGCLVAIPSGAAAAIAVLGGNVGSLVGVAISASILPPAVNSGIVWAFASVCMIYEADETQFNFADKKKLYSDDQTYELLIRGGISMCITISNVICIYIMGILVLKVKEIAPVISRNNRQFWKHDIKIVRDLSKNCNSNDSDIIEGITTLPSTRSENKDNLLFRPKVMNAMNIGNASYQNTWSPMGNRHTLGLFDNSRANNLRELEKLYMTVTRPNCEIGRYPRTNFSCNLYDIQSSRGSSSFNASPISIPRRTQIALETLQGAKQQFRSRVGSNFKWEPLKKVYDDDGSPTVHIENQNKLKSNLDNERKSIRKFTITPAIDITSSPCSSVSLPDKK